MKILKILLTAVLVIGFIMPGCNNDLGCNCGMISKYFDTGDIQAGVDEPLGVNASDAYQWQDFRGQITYETTFYGDLELNNLTKSDYDFSLIPTASACSCPPDGYKGGEEGIDSLIITTLYDYNLNFPADSDLATITEVNFAGDNFELLQDYLVRNDDAIFEQQHIYRFLQAP